jgi:hypothetical protein
MICGALLSQQLIFNEFARRFLQRANYIFKLSMVITMLAASNTLRAHVVICALTKPDVTQTLLYCENRIGKFLAQ